MLEKVFANIAVPTSPSSAFSAKQCEIMYVFTDTNMQKQEETELEQEKLNIRKLMGYGGGGAVGKQNC